MYQMLYAVHVCVHVYAHVSKCAVRARVHVCLGCMGACVHRDVFRWPAAKCRTRGIHGSKWNDVYIRVQVCASVHGPSACACTLCACWCACMRASACVHMRASASRACVRGCKCVQGSASAHGCMQVVHVCVCMLMRACKSMHAVECMCAHVCMCACVPACV